MMAKLTLEQLESLRTFHGGWSNPLIDLALKGLEAEKLTEQRDALLAALKDIRDDVSVKLPEQLRRHNLQDMARAAIAAVEGKT